MTGSAQSGMSKLARCTADPSCPRRWATGSDRNCGGHPDGADDASLAARMEALGAAMAAAPGDGEPAALNSRDW
jgi:hypothetical protein